MPGVAVALETVWLREPLAARLVRKGEEFPADDPIVERHPAAFRVRSEGRAVEQMTKAPGEARPVRPPR